MTVRRVPRVFRHSRHPVGRLRTLSCNTTKKRRRPCRHMSRCRRRVPRTLAPTRHSAAKSREVPNNAARWMEPGGTMTIGLRNSLDERESTGSTAHGSGPGRPGWSGRVHCSEAHLLAHLYPPPSRTSVLSVSYDFREVRVALQPRVGGATRWSCGYLRARGRGSRRRRWPAEAVRHGWPFARARYAHRRGGRWR